MLLRYGIRLLRETDPRLLAKFVYTFGWKGMRAVRQFKKRRAGGSNFPAFLVLSVTDACNLSCQGCWVTTATPPRQLSLDQMDKIIRAAKTHGSYFFGLLGGEPLLHPELFNIIEKHPDCYFQVFSNGTLLSDEIAARMRELGNVTPLISIEGIEEVSDVRRGGEEVYQRTMAGLDNCRRHKLITGVATSICKSNFDDLVSEKFVSECISRGVHYLWYYIYRPVGPRPNPELALSEDEILSLRRFLVHIRPKVPLLVIDAYWDAEGRALCPGAMAMSHHIGPGGDVEFCPPLQFAVEKILAEDDITGLLENSEFLESLRNFIRNRTRGCIIMEDPDGLHGFLTSRSVNDSSGRNTALNELRAMAACPGHHIPGREIPEKSRLYRFAKKHWFFGFGAYG